MLKNLDHYIFDFDGTIMDSAEGILNAYLYALKHFGIEEKDTLKIRNQIGAPLSVTFKDIYGFDDEKTAVAINELRVYYADKGIYENKVYPGIMDMLKGLADKGKKMSIATAKPQPYAIEIAKHYGLFDYFEHIEGSSLSGDILEKYVVIDNLRQHFDLDHDTTKMVMIGDSRFDVMGGHHHHMQTIAVGYGFGENHVLKDCKPHFFAETVAELTDLLV